MYQSSRLRNLTISKSKTFAGTVAILFFFVSLYIYPFYTSGDQVFYRRFYEDVIGESFVDAFLLYQNTLGSSEPGYFLVVKLFANFIQKDTLMSLLNAALVYSLLTWSTRKRVSWIAISLLSVNFYLLVLFFSAERLKLALLLLMIAVNSVGLKKPLFAATAFLSHTQTALLIVNWITLRAMPALKDLMAAKLEKGAWKILVILLICGLMLVPMADHMQAKFEAYDEISGGFSELIKPSIFIALTLIYARGQRLNAFAMHFPIAIAALLVGGNRTVIFSYFVFLSYALQFRNGLNLGVLLTSVYFMLQGLDFLQKVFVYGNGFYGI